MRIAARASRAGRVNAFTGTTGNVVTDEATSGGHSFAIMEVESSAHFNGRERVHSGPSLIIQPIRLPPDGRRLERVSEARTGCYAIVIVRFGSVLHGSDSAEQREQ